MRFKPSVALAWVLVAVPVFIDCECEQTRVDVDQSLAGHFHVSEVSEVPDFNLYGEVTPSAVEGEGEIDVDFGRVDLGVQASKYLFIRNTGSAALNVVGVEWDEEVAGFSLTCQESGEFVPCAYTGSDYLAIPPGGDLIVEMTFSPQEERAYQGRFSIRSNAADFQLITVSLTGEGVTPEIQVCISDCEGDQGSEGCQQAEALCNDGVAPENLRVAYGDVVVGASASRLVTIHNIGTQSLRVETPQITGGDFGQFGWELVDGNLPGEIGSGESVVVEVRYAPLLGGQHASTLEIISNDINESEIRVDLVGQAIAPRVCPDPMSLAFGSVGIGEPAVQSFTLTNCGLLELEIENLAMNEIPGHSPDFSLVDLPELPIRLQPEDSVEISVQFNPSVVGPATGGVDIFSNDPASNPETHLTGTISLTGNGFQRVCQIQVNPPGVVNFGGVVQNAADPDDDKMVVRLLNSGNDTCTFHSAEITVNTPQNEFSILLTPEAETTFEPGDVVEIELLYAPVDLGLDNGTMTVHSSDYDEPDMDVQLVGEGVAEAVCDLVVSPEWLHFGTTKLNTTRVLYVELKNEGHAPCIVETLEYRTGYLFPHDFTITSAPSTPIHLFRKGRPGDTQEIEVTFAPSQVNLHKAGLWIETSTDPDFQVGGELSPLQAMWFCSAQPAPGQGCVAITGNSAESDIEVVPGELDFGVVTVGCNSPDMRVTVYNLGGYELQVSSIYLENMADPNFEIIQAPNTPFTLAGGSSFQVVLRYHPQDYTAHRNALYIESDASNEDLLVVPLFGMGTDMTQQTDIFHQPDEVKSDVLFVVDNSGSMGWAQDELADNFDYFISWAISRDVDYHIGVTSTEVNEPETDQGDPPRDIIPGVLVHPTNRPPFITNQTPDFEQAFAENVHVGICCSDEQEAGLEAAWMALSEPLITDPQANAGFLREDAKLYIVCVSDEQDQSRGNPDFYVDYFSHIKGPRNREMMKVSAICGDAPDGCGGETAQSGSRYIEVANRTGGIFESICTSNWAMALENLGIDAFAFIQEFPLTRPAESDSIVVTVDGMPVDEASVPNGADGWTYIEDTNSVFFGDDVVPEQGARIVITYTAACL
ncbi:MAG: choice-of-anchor D domain-containing protein [Deltaproteobacteria bacterium]|nr:choice-of-anchor D domain-containing protein [Deltaproteobacteria bacterium]